jgi:hypothetical protein
MTSVPNMPGIFSVLGPSARSLSGHMTRDLLRVCLKHSTLFVNEHLVRFRIDRNVNTKGFRHEIKAWLQHVGFPGGRKADLAGVYLPRVPDRGVHNCFTASPKRGLARESDQLASLLFAQREPDVSDSFNVKSADVFD